MICHFLVKSKPHERIDLLITTSVNIYQTKKYPIVIKTGEAIWKPPLSKRNPPFQLTPLFQTNFFMTPLFIQISKTRTHPP